MDKNGDRLGDFAVFNFDNNGNEKLAAIWNNGNLTLRDGFLYPGGASLPPKDATDPKDVADFASWSDGAGIFAIVATAVGLLAAVATLLGYLYFRKSMVINLLRFMLDCFSSSVLLYPSCNS